MKLLVAIPALDEEESIRSIIERSLEARQHIIGNSPVTDVEITVVSDGSTDRTAKIAGEYDDRIGVIVFPENRGYGAAISEAWRSSDAELLGFLDADGTCDPRFFADLCTEIERAHSDVVLGCRLTPESRMPATRRFGNRVFAATLSLLSLTRVRDAASGMRVVRRSSLPVLLPLPDGLDFTPAMSARAILSRELRISELDMPYHERTGESKLHPLRDGLRFARVIAKTAFLYLPSRPLGLVSALLLAGTMVMMAWPTWYWLENGRLEEWMIYRFLVAELFLTIAVLCTCAGYLGRKAADISLSSRPSRDKYRGILGPLFGSRWFWALPALLMAGGAALVWDAWYGFWTTGKVYEHWSRFVAMVFLFSLAANLVVTKLLDYCLNLLADRLEYLRAAPSAAGKDSETADAGRSS